MNQGTGCLYLQPSYFQIKFDYFNLLKTRFSGENTHSKLVMTLFAQTVIKKHIESLDTLRDKQKWLQFKSRFHNTENQPNIYKNLRQPN
jgi:hypothetical protein